MSSAADYPDFEAALQAASSRFGATHVVRQGNRSAIIYSPTSKGYERRSLSCDRGFFHWPKQADLVDEVPENAERVVDVLDIGFDPDAPPRTGTVPVRRAAEEARGSDRERWEKLQSEFRRLTDEMTKVESEAHVKFGPHGLRYAARSLQTKHEKLVASRNRVYEKIFAMTQKLSPRDWGTGVPTWWVAGKLTFDDLVRPIGEPLSVTPPLAYGATRPMQEANEARATTYTIDDDPADVPVGQVVWLKKAPAEKVGAFLDAIDRRGLTMIYAGPGDRYRVVQKGAREMGAVREVREVKGKKAPAATPAKTATSTSTSSVAPTSTKTQTSTRAHTSGNVTVTGGAGNGNTTVKIEAAREPRRAASEGRRYESAQWLEFECEPATPTPELEEMAAEFKKLLLEFLESYARTWSIDTGSLDEDSFVWNTYASLVGHGVGLWEGDGDTGLRGEDEKKIDKALRGRWSARGSLVGKLHELAHRISDECSMLSEGAGGREAREEASIPTKAQLKVIEAFRQRRLMGNPMRDSISTDGDVIYSYRMPIAGRKANFSIWITDPSSAPSATTRNHIYGLQRTFSPAEITGEAAEARRGERVTTPHGDRFEVVEYTLPVYWASYLINDDASGLEDGEQEQIDAWLEREGNPYFVDVSDDSHFAGRNDATNLGGDVATYTAHMRPGGRGTAPDSGGGVPRMQPGYAFYTPSKRKGDWKKIPNDDWEHVVVGEDEIGKSSFVGIRDIDGSMHDIFEIYFEPGKHRTRWRAVGYYAQLQTHTRGRGAAHEFASGPQTAMAREFASGPQTAMDFASPKDAIAHAQRSWGATHVDFHGTRNRPTVYGTKAGARWKKTLFKEKGKFHWPDKFAKGPKRLSGAIELTPVAAPARPSLKPGDVVVAGPWPKQGVPDNDDRHLPGQSDEAREEDRRYTTKQSQQEALRDDVFFEGQWIGQVQGPYKRSFRAGGRADFYEWKMPRASHQDAPPFGQAARFGEARTRRAAISALVRTHKQRGGHGAREGARENPATDLQDAIPWVRVTRDPERYKEALARAQKIGPVDDAKKVYELVGPALMKEDQETFIVVLIDVRQNCRGVAEIHRGARSRVATSVLDVMRIVVAAGAEGFIVCHNHPSGKAMPSDADRDLTKAIQRAAKPFAGETAFLDHVVIGAGEYFSFADNKLHRAKN